MLPVAVMVAVNVVHSPAFIVTLDGEIEPSLTERANVVPSVPQGAALKVRVAVPLTVNVGVVAVPLTLPVPNLAHLSAPDDFSEVHPELSALNFEEAIFPLHSPSLPT